jgi:hypothetical protein
MTAANDQTRAHALVADLYGVPDAAADRAVAVLHAHAAALTWVHDTTDAYPAPSSVAAELERVAEKLRSGADDRDPVGVLGQAAVDALAVYQAATVA